MAFFLIVLLHVGSYILGPFDTMDACLAKAHSMQERNAICVQGQQ